MIVGVDEVGRGSLAGPLVAAAVVLDKRIVGIKDSKQLTKVQRERLDIRIREKALSYGIGWATPQEVDECGLTGAVRLAMERAVACITMPYEQIIIDGNYNFLASNPKSTCVIKADETVPVVGAASIIAKVARDAYMVEAAQTYPGYFFDSHVGYATQAHMRALQELGACDLHRRSFAPVQATLGLA